MHSFSKRGAAAARSVPAGLAVFALLLAACGGGSGGQERPRIAGEVSPASRMVPAGGRVQLTATVTGTADSSVAWTATAGTVDAGGLFTAPEAPGPVTVTATSTACGDCSASASLQVGQVAVSGLPAIGSVLPGHALKLSATVTGWSDTSVTWKATAGTVDATGLFTAPDALGPVTVTATSTACPEGTASATVSVLEIPVMTVTTEKNAEILSKTDYVIGQVSIDPKDGVSSAFGPVPMKIRGRGNSTWGLDKKPYKLKLDDKAGLLGMPEDKEWALLANHSDKTLLRNSVALELGRRLGMDWVPRSRFVELTLRGEYVGTYLLIETVKVAPSRVNVTKMAETDVTEPAVSGGYLFEIDQRAADPDKWVELAEPGHSVVHPYVLKEPDGKVQKQFDWISKYLRQAQTAIFGADFANATTGYQAYWDVQSLVDWYLVNELVKNVDGSFYSSAFVHKERGGLLHMGPLWDFDIALGNVTYRGCDSPEGWYIRTQSDNAGPSYYERLFEDPAFVARYRARWHEVKESQIETIFQYIDEAAAILEHAQAHNFTKWSIDESVWPNPPTYGSYQAEVDHLKKWLRERIDWIDANIDLDP